MVGDNVDDVMQITYLAAFKSWSQFSGRSAPTTWLYSIAVRAALDHLRTTRRSAGMILRLRHPTVVEDTAAIASESIDLARALQRLPIDQRVVLLLVDGQGFSHEDAAAALNIPIGTVGSRLSRSRTAMREALRGDLA